MNINTVNKRLLFTIILVTAAFLRFWDWFSLPFMHDEFSALFRTQFDSLWEVIKKGVIPDAHPPGVQLFLYFLTKLFGFSEPILKLPFILTGVGSVLFIYLIAKKWFGETPALFSAAFITVLQYNIFYSEIIRPYEPGLFFSLGTTYFWTLLLLQKQPSRSAQIGFILFMTVNNYLHAFTIFLDLMIALSGFWFLKGKKLKNYLLALGTIFILSIPSMIIFLIQLKRGDIGGWLAPPQYDFLIDFFKYIFHYSKFFFAVVIFLTFYTVHLEQNKKKTSVPFRLLAIIWFFATFLTAYLYSVFRSPILQFSTLYFTFPFLVMFFFSFVGDLKYKQKILFVAIILFVGITTLVLEREHYRLMTRQGLNEIPKLVISDLPKYPQKSIVLQAPETKMFDHYFNRYGKKPAYVAVEKKEDLKKVWETLDRETPHTVIIGLADYAPLTLLETLKSYYPLIVEKKVSQNMEYWILTRDPAYVTTNAGTTRNLKADRSFFEIKSEEKYKGGIVLQTDSLKLDEYDVLNVQAKIKTEQTPPDAFLVVDWKTASKKQFFWAGARFSDFYRKNDSSYFVTFSSRMMNFKKIPKGSTIQFYIWKKDSSQIKVDNLKVYFTHLNPIEFGLFKKIR